MKVELKRKQSINADIYSKLCGRTSIDEADLSIISKTDGFPDYDSYKHLLEDQKQISDLLELANEELMAKDKLLEKVITTANCHR